MSKLGKLLELGLVSKALAEGAALRRLLPRLMAIVISAVATGIMLGALLVIIAYTAYHALTQHGMDSDIALPVIGVVFALLTVGGVAWTIQSLQKVKIALLPQSRLQSVIDAFIAGFQKKRREP